MSAGLPHPSYHAPYKLQGTGGLSHLRVVFSCFSFHRLIRRCFHNNNHNFPTEPCAHRTDAHNTLFPTEPGAHRTDPLNKWNDNETQRNAKAAHTHRLTPLSSPHRGVRFDRATAVLYRLLCPAAQYPTKNSLILAPSGKFITRYANMTLPDRQLLEGMPCLPVLCPSSNCR